MDDGVWVGVVVLEGSHRPPVKANATAALRLTTSAPNTTTRLLPDGPGNRDQRVGDRMVNSDAGSSEVDFSGFAVVLCFSSDLPVDSALTAVVSSPGLRVATSSGSCGSGLSAAGAVGAVAVSGDFSGVPRSLNSMPLRPLSVATKKAVAIS